MKRYLGMLLILGSMVAYAQKRSNTTTANGDCNGTAVGTNITIVVKCEDGVSKEQAQELANEYRDLLKTVKGQIKSENLNFQDAITRLKDIQSKLSILQIGTKGRQLTSDQIARLQQAVSKFNQPYSGLTIRYTLDPETASYAKNFFDGLRMSPTAPGIIGIMQSTNTQTGVYLQISSADFGNRIVPPVCDAIGTFMHNEKIEFTAQAITGLESGACLLDIKPKPITY
jgi:hypothetical protein